MAHLRIGQWRVLSLLACCLVAFRLQDAVCAPARAEGEVSKRVLKLSPRMPCIPDPGVPALSDTPPDADVVAEKSLAIDPVSPYRWVASPGQSFELNVSAKAGEEIDRAVLTVWDWENRPVAQVTFAVPFAEAVECKVEGRGAYVLTLDGMRGKDCRLRLVRSFSVCPSNEARRSLWKNSGFWVGQCSFPGWHDVEIRGRSAHPPGLTADESRNLEAELVARMGAQVARINLNVQRRDTEGLDLDFTLTDKCVNAYVSRGMDLDVQLFGPYGDGPGPVLDKYAGKPEDAIYPLKEKPYRHYVRETAARYAKHARFFQIGNEPGNPHQYGGTAEEFVDQVKQAVDEIRRAAPRIPITNGGYCFANEDTQRVIDGVRGLTDFVSYHWHGDLPGMKQFWADIDRLHRKAGYSDIRYANTEMGYHMPTVGGERTNAVCEMQKLLYCWAHGQIGVLLYSSRELSWPRQHEAEYGFVDYFFCPRFVYGAVSAFLDRYAGFRFERIIRESDNLHAYEFRSGSRRMIAVFALKPPVKVTLKTDARSATLLDPMGNESAISDAKRVTIQAGEYPQAVVLDEASTVEL